MAVHSQLNDRHHIQIFNVVHLGSYAIFDLWSTGFSFQGHTLQWAIIFSTLSINSNYFLKKLFLLQNVCFDLLYNIFLNHFYCKKRERINQQYPQIFKSKSRFSYQIYAKFEFSWQGFEKYLSTKYHELSSMSTDGRTDMTKLIVPFRNLTHLIRSHFFPFPPYTESVNNTSRKFRRN